MLKQEDPRISLFETDNAADTILLQTTEKTKVPFLRSKVRLLPQMEEAKVLPEGIHLSQFPAEHLTADVRKYFALSFILTVPSGSK